MTTQDGLISIGLFIRISVSHVLSQIITRFAARTFFSTLFQYIAMASAGTEFTHVTMLQSRLKRAVACHDIHGYKDTINIQNPFARSE